MSIPVALPDLAATLQRYGFAYLLSTEADGSPRVVAISPVLWDGALLVSRAGRSSTENARRQPAVTLVWPPRAEQEYSLIVDGTARIVGESIRIRPSHAVLHRPAPTVPAAK